MPRDRRADRPGALHHVTSRGQAHRPLFETATDVATFLWLLRRQVQDGHLEVLAYSVLSTHFHLLARTPDGSLARRLQWVLARYAEWFNRTRERDGHAFKGRYFAKCVEDHVYLANVVAYIDRNAVDAGLVTTPEAYPHATARYYMGEPAPPWLQCVDVERLICRIARAARYTPALYPALWKACPSEVGEAVVARAVSGPRLTVAPLAVLVQAGPEAVQRWLREVTALEEGRRVPSLALPGASVRRACAPDGRWPGTELGWMCAGLLSRLAGWPAREIGAALGLSPSRAARVLARHRERMREGGPYAAEAGRRVAGALRACYGSLGER